MDDFALVCFKFVYGKFSPGLRYRPISLIMLLLLSILKLLGAISFFTSFEGFSVLIREAVNYFLGYLFEEGEMSGHSEELLYPRVVIA